MNRGEIPGFYYDEDKKKYFRIQANHLVPRDANYSKGKVKQKMRQAKKQKLEDRKQVVRRRHTVKRNLILQHPVLGGTGLGREHGLNLPVGSLIQRDAALIPHWRPSRVNIEFPGMETCPEINLSSATYISATSQMLAASIHSHTRVSTLHVCNDWDWSKYSCEIGPGCGLAAFNTQVTSISSTTHSDGNSRVFVTSHQRSASGQIFTGLVPAPDSEVDVVVPAGMFVNIGDKYELVNSSSLNQTTGLAAVLGTSRIVVLDANLDVIARYRFLAGREYDNHSIDWLDSNTVAWSYNDMHSGRNRVMLWDTRTKGGTSERFILRGRITGVLNPSSSTNSSSGHHLLVSTNHRINLFDTRMPYSFGSRNVDNEGSRPLLSFEHVHQGPVLEYDVNEAGQLIAAADRDNVVQIYSIRSGRRVRSLEMPDRKASGPTSELVKTLQWYEDESEGSALVACKANGVVRWAWDGMDHG